MRRVLAVAVALVALGACRGSDPNQAPQVTASPAATATPLPSPAPGALAAGPTRDLAVDESMGGHTLARHVGRTDAQLADRLRQEQVSAASTWTDRATAERGVGAALATAGGKLSSWQRRSGRRPNLVLHYTERTGAPLGRSLFRGAPGSIACDRVLVVLKWDERHDRFFVLTSYPDCER